MAKRKPATIKASKSSEKWSPREARSRGYAAGYDGKPVTSGDGSKAWTDGWNAAVDATGGAGGKIKSGSLFS